MVIFAKNIQFQLGQLVIGVLVCWPGGKADIGNANEPIEFFENRIRPLLIEHCYECHAGEEQSGGLVLDTKDGWQAGGDSGPVIVSGAPASSRLIEAVRYDNLDLQMPPSGKLSDQEINALVKWVTLGAPDPRRAEPGSDMQDSPGEPTKESLEAPGDHRFWCFRPVANPRFPTVQDRDWVRSPIDAFVLSHLEEHGLTPAPPADKRTLIRRVTFDLIGLPPTPAEVGQFLADESPAAFERVIERLLASPHYGERWGRHWLDVARYADSNGLDENLAFGNAWRYRDYVVDSYNDDKPFDRFATEQLAGDLLPQANQETLTATGFLALGAKVLAEPDREKLTMDTVDEQIDTVGKAFLGMTLGCARCHDHKFDPLKQEDYYALAAIFKSTQTFGEGNLGAIKYWYEHSFATDKEREELASVEAEIKAKQQAAAQFRNQAMARLREEAVSRAADYLAAATKFKPDASLEEIGRIAEHEGLHARMLHHCRLHLAYNSDDPLVVQWKKLAAQASDADRLGDSKAAERVRSYFRALFAAGEESSNDSGNVNENPPRPQEFQDLVSHARAALADKAGFLTVPPQPEHAFDPETLAKYYRLMDEARLVESNAPDERGAMGVTDGQVLVSLPIHIRGSHRNLGQPVSRNFPEVMRLGNVRPIFPRDESGRLELAKWIASSQHPLTPRVYVNRVWRWHFGRGLVATTENFGRLGERPTHPQLLDWMARYFMESGWSTKQLHRLILLSNTYRMQARHDSPQAAEQTDPENRWLWKFPRQRLEAEAIRDAILAVAGRLDTTLGGKTIPLRNRQFVFNHTSVDHTKYDSLRRAIYLPVVRNNLYDFFTQFDFPDPTMPTGDRQATVVAPQALWMMNDELVMDAAQALAQRVLDRYSLDQQRIRDAYLITLARSASDEEVHRATAFLRQLVKEYPELDELERWSLFCHSLLASNEFLYVN